MLKEWTEQELTKTSLCGIRKYTTNSVLALHVDRMPLVMSTVINVAHDAKKPWIMELWDMTEKLTMSPWRWGIRPCTRVTSWFMGGIGRSRASIMPICKYDAMG